MMTNYHSHHNHKVASWNYDDRIPMVIKSMIISYLSFRSYLTIMRLSRSWKAASLRTEAKSPQQQAASFIIHSPPPSDDSISSNDLDGCNNWEVLHQRH
jgi:hypothetical protein